MVIGLLAALIKLYRTLISSAEPAVVFTALARLCVPRLRDSCTVAIIEEQMPGYRIEFPRR